MSDMPIPLTPAHCYDEMKEVLDQVDRLIMEAPLDEKNKTGLSLLVAEHFYGMTASYLNKDVEIGAREVCDLIVATMRPDKPKISIVEEEVF